MITNNVMQIQICENITWYLLKSASENIQTHPGKGLVFGSIEGECLLQFTYPSSEFVFKVFGNSLSNNFIGPLQNQLREIKYQVCNKLTNFVQLTPGHAHCILGFQPPDDVAMLDDNTIRYNFFFCRICIKIQNLVTNKWILQVDYLPD